MSKSTLPSKSKKDRPKVTKHHLYKARAELEEIQSTMRKLATREHELRNKIADLFHTGEDGTENIEIHGLEVKVRRSLNVSIPKDAKDQLEEDAPELYAKVFVTKESLDSSAAKKLLDDLEDYAVTKQGLPTVTFAEIE